ncbi:hypothetical protein CHS0354_020937 [Potamilus streckersoni]|uniref:Uncharacterized protein n=1 Tax=Potamilus streckersoni TaxID=2493646 RepID=A0AAE0W057_9BIVA|nr:hypothetical protein CHS0354_020937 [Potamilus streckersoni]
MDEERQWTMQIKRKRKTHPSKEKNTQEKHDTETCRNKPSGMKIAKKNDVHSKSLVTEKTEAPQNELIIKDAEALENDIIIKIKEEYFSEKAQQSNGRQVNSITVKEEEETQWKSA